VNLAGRLEGLCPQYGVGLVVSGETKDVCGDAFAFQCLDTIRVKGKEQPVTIYLPLRREELAAWEKAREKYAAGDFTAAATRLAALREEFPETKLYAAFADRVSRLLSDAPSL